jgi:hypothetical protein
VGPIGPVPRAPRPAWHSAGMNRLHRPGWRVAIVLAVAIGTALAAMAALVLQRTPRVPQPTAVSAGDIERAVQLLRRHDPRRHPPGTAHRAVLSAQDIELLLNHGARRWRADAAVRVALSPGAARIQASTRAGLPLQAWLNLELTLVEGERMPVIDGARVGALPLPGWMAQRLARRASLRLGLDPDAPWARELVSRVALHRDAAVVSYTWRADTRQQLLGSLLPVAEQARLKAYAVRLAELSAAAPGDGRVSLGELLPPMFTLAAQRSGGDGAAAAAENRAALVVLGLHVSGRRLSSWVPAASEWPQPRWMHITLHGRDDFPQHFLLSALLAAEGSSPLADAAGTYKELHDARAGSGFSFNDIAADRAGTRFGEVAVQQPLRLQAALAAARRDSDLMPDVGDLPEFLPEAEFRRRYGGVGAPAYQRLLAEIDARIVATPLLH